MEEVVCAGNFFSAAFENRCTAVAGASGGIFGLLGLFIADMVLNFETLTRYQSQYSARSTYKENVFPADEPAAVEGHLRLRV